jgi:hypothetical protein
VDSLLRPNIWETTFRNGEAVVQLMQYEHFGSSFKNSCNEPPLFSMGEPSEAPMTVPLDGEAVGVDGSGDERNKGVPSIVCVAIDEVISFSSIWALGNPDRNAGLFAKSVSIESAIMNRQPTLCRCWHFFSQVAQSHQPRQNYSFAP